MSQQEPRKQERRDGCISPKQKRCKDCPFKDIPLRKLMGDDYWKCVECHYLDNRLDELVEAEYIRAFRRGRKEPYKLDSHTAEDLGNDYCLKILKSKWDRKRSKLKTYLNAILRNVVKDCRRINNRMPLVLVNFREPDPDDKGGFPEPEARNDIDTKQHSEKSEEALEDQDVARLLEEYRHEREQRKEREEKYLNELKSKGKKEEAEIVRLLLKDFKATDIVKQLGLKSNQRVWNVKERYLKPFVSPP